VGHQNFACGLQHQHMRVVHAAEGGANIVQTGTNQPRKRDNDWCLTRANDFVVNEKTEDRILEHGGNVTGDANSSQARKTARKNTESRKFAKGFQNAAVFQRFVSAFFVYPGRIVKKNVPYFTRKIGFGKPESHWPARVGT